MAEHFTMEDMCRWMFPHLEGWSTCGRLISLSSAFLSDLRRIWLEILKIHQNEVSHQSWYIGVFLYQSYIKVNARSRRLNGQVDQLFN